MTQILVTGATGLLGSTLVPHLRLFNLRLKTQGRSGGVDYQVNLADPTIAISLLDKVRPSVVINLIGLTNVDYCEAQPDAAYITNTRVVENIVGWISKKKAACHLIQISTDQVYDGAGPHNENGTTLRNYYAFSKYAGELAASATSSTILRTNFFGRSRCSTRESLSDWIFRSLSCGDGIKVFDDSLFSPLSMESLSKMIAIVLQERPLGVFNLGSRNGMSKAEFAFAFANASGLRIDDVTRTTIDEAKFLKAYRPKDMRMDCSKFEMTLNLLLPDLSKEIELVAKDYNEQTGVDLSNSRR